MTDHTEETFIPRTHYLLDAGAVADMLAELAAARRCEDCTGEPAICVEGSEEWELVQTHDTTCPALLELRRQGGGDRP
jgi:hypothetical protein